jgi:hypothetical protein
MSGGDCRDLVGHREFVNGRHLRIPIFLPLMVHSADPTRHVNGMALHQNPCGSMLYIYPMAHGHHRKNIRLKDYDYTTNGAYFVTFCSYEKKCTLGSVTADAKVDLSPMGQIIHDEIANTNNDRTGITST